MPQIHVNLAGVAQEAMPEGYYPAIVSEAKIGTSRAGKPKLEVHFDIMQVGFEGRKAFANYSLQPQALWNLRRFLKALELDFDLDGELELDTDDLLGAEVTLLMEQQEWEGEMRNSVQRVLPAGMESGPEAAGEEGIADW